MTIRHKSDHPSTGEHSLCVKFDETAITKEGVIEGYASMFGERDQGDDIVMYGAFSKSLSARPAEGVKLLWQHNPYEVIGKWTDLQEDDKGLYAKGRLFSSVQRGKEAIELAREGAVDGLSIGYRTKDSEYLESGVRILKELDLREVSMVTFPMLESARLSAVKALSDLKTIRDFEEALVNGTLPPLPLKDAKALLAEGFTAIRTERDAGSSGEDEELAEALRNLAAFLTAQ